MFNSQPPKTTATSYQGHYNFLRFKEWSRQLRIQLLESSLIQRLDVMVSPIISGDASCLNSLPLDLNINVHYSSLLVFFTVEKTVQSIQKLIVRTINLIV